MVTSQNPIGILDSGVGGLSVLRAVSERLPSENLLYFADQAHVPYGSRPREEVRQFTLNIVHYLLSQQVKLVVVACNTASAVALRYLRKIFPEIPFVGMEPAVKPAAEHTESGVVGVLATPSTFQGELYASVVERFANGVNVLQDTCSGLVEEIEKGALRSQTTYQILEKALLPMVNQGMDRVVMGCTHYPFVIPVIKEIVGERVEVIDPAPAIARQVERLLERHDLRFPNGQGEVRVVTTGEVEALKDVLPRLIGERRWDWDVSCVRLSASDEF